jgi:uncharacterized membrane protein YgdD (TMEM256/DUF423 family)
MPAGPQIKTNDIAGATGARIVFALACVMMAIGIGMAALAAHAGAGPEIGTAATLLLANAPMLAATGIALRFQLVRFVLGAIGASIALAGTSLFAADMAHRGFGHGALLPDAAPIGGSMDILGWVVVAIAAVTSQRA